MEREGWRERLGGGFRFARRHRTLRMLLVGQSLALVLFTLVIPIEIIYAKESLGTTSAGFGVLLASWGAGIVVGSVIYLVVRQRSPLLVIALSTAAIGAAYLGMATAQSLTVACLVSVVGGAGNGIQWISVVTAVQEATPTDYQARIVGFLESIGAAMPGLGYILGGGLVAIGSPRTAYAAAGAGVLALVAVAALARPRLERPSGTPPFVADTRPDEVPLSDSLAPAPRFETSGRDLR